MSPRRLRPRKHGSKLRKRKYSPHVPSPDTKADETCFRLTSDGGDPSVPGTKAYKEMVATCRRLHEWSKGSCCIFEFDDPSSLDAEGKEPKSTDATSSSQEALEVEEAKTTAALSLKEDLEQLYSSLTFQPGADVLDGSFFINSDDDTSDGSSVSSIQYNYDYDCKVRRTEGLFDPPNVEF